MWPLSPLSSMLSCSFFVSRLKPCIPYSAPPVGSFCFHFVNETQPARVVKERLVMLMHVKAWLLSQRYFLYVWVHALCPVTDSDSPVFKKLSKNKHGRRKIDWRNPKVEIHVFNFFFNSAFGLGFSSSVVSKTFSRVATWTVHDSRYSVRTHNWWATTIVDWTFKCQMVGD